MHISNQQTLIILTLALFARPSFFECQTLTSSPSGPAAPLVTSAVLGRVDAAATAMLDKHQAVVGSDAWTGMQATGTMTFGGKSSPSYPATLSNQGPHNFRLDVQTSMGESSIRIHGFAGTLKNEDGTTAEIASDSAIMGLFPFQLARHGSYPKAGLSLLDRGMAPVEGSSLHRITFELPALGRNPTTKARNTVPVDLYFDPETQLLVRSVTSSTVPNARNVKFLFEVTYGDYRQVGTSMIPFLYTETMQGLPYRTLQLTRVELNPSLDPTYFEF